MMFRRISLLNLNPERFSTNEEDGFIRVVKGEQMGKFCEGNQNHWHSALWVVQKTILELRAEGLFVTKNLFKCS